jgi:hypothetical protein
MSNERFRRSAMSDAAALESSAAPSRAMNPGKTDCGRRADVASAHRAAGMESPDARDSW